MRRSRQCRHYRRRGSAPVRQPPGQFAVFLGGSPQRKGGEAVPASLSTLDGTVTAYRLEDDSPESERRLRLAEWITHPDNPLTPAGARQPPVALPLRHRHRRHAERFRLHGRAPDPPELLDFLALKLKENGWRLKPMHRLIMNSRQLPAIIAVGRRSREDRQ